jgi:hypothetical protein
MEARSSPLAVSLHRSKTGVWVQRCPPRAMHRAPAPKLAKRTWIGPARPGTRCFRQRLRAVSLIVFDAAKTKSRTADLHIFLHIHLEFG